MKKIVIITLFATFIIEGFSQEISADDRSVGKVSAAADSADNTKVVIGQDLITIEDKENATDLRLGNRGMTILESYEGIGPKFEFKHFRGPSPFCNDDEEADTERPARKHFKGHWAGLGIGFNNYLSPDNSASIPDYMSLHSGKSRNFNFNFSQLSLGLTRRIGFVTGLGFNWNNFMFSGNNSIQKGAQGVIVVFDTTETLKKSKLTTLYLNLPFLIEFQIPADHRQFNVAFGPVGGIKLLSHTAMVFENNDKMKSDDDFSLNLLRYGLTVRIGYENFNIFGTYNITPLFQKDKGPGGIDLYPYEIGFAFTID